MTPKCPDCKRDQDDCVCVDELETLRAQVAEIKEGMAYRNSLVGRLEAERDELKRQKKVLWDALNLWKVASDNAEESELDNMTCYCIPMPLFCDACEATEAIDAALAAPKGDI